MTEAVATRIASRPRLEVQLDHPLPSRLAVGRATSLLLSGNCRAPGRITELRVLVDDAAHPVMAQRMPDDGVVKAGSRWWAIVSFEPRSRPGSARIELQAELPGGRQVAHELGTIALPADQLEPEPPRVNAPGPVGQPFVAICMATFDPPSELFEQQIASIRDQSHRNWVCIVSDDASSERKIGEIEAVLGEDPRFLLNRSDIRVGAYANFERAMALAPRAADYVALADQDDRWHADKLETLLAALRPQSQLVYSDARLVRADGSVISDTYWERRRNNHTNLASLLIANTVTGAASLFRRELLDRALPLPPRVADAYHDHWLASVALTVGEIDYVDRPLYDYVQHEGSAIGHRKTNRRAAAPLRARVGARLWKRGTRPGWQAIYRREYWRILLTARVLRARCADEASPRKRRVLERLIASDSLRGAAWLSVRARRAWLGRNETMGLERELARAIVTRRLAAALARVPRRSAFANRRIGEPPEHAAPAARGDAEHPPRAMIEVEGLDKSFRIPGEAPQRRGVRSMLRSRSATELHVLEDISFSVEPGEFFGIVGRNGSGKSTLLKLMASTYRADRGSIRLTGRVAPIIELGVGFHPDLTARDNVVLNGVMMGLTIKEARKRFEEVVAFAEVEDFVGLKLKNYSTGMRARLAFAVAVRSNADVLLIDEVLAVGDAAFREKCATVFDRYREEGKTIVLVSQSMEAIRRHCHRAMLLEGGRIERIGDPEEVTRHYMSLLQASAGEGSRLHPSSRAVTDPPFRVERVWADDKQGADPSAIQRGQPIRLHAIVELQEPIQRPRSRFELRNEDDVTVFAPPARQLDIPSERLMPGSRIHVETTIEKSLAPGRYSASCVIAGLRAGNDVSVSSSTRAEFAVAGRATPGGRGLFELEHRTRARIIDGGRQPKELAARARARL